MKGIYLIAVAFLAQAVIAANQTTFEAEDECPTKDPCPPKLIFHEEDCTRYYECRNGDKILKKCKEGLHFSKKWHGCVQPAKSECEDEDDGKCKEGDLLPHECQCTKFYECKKNRKVLHECNPGEYFDEERKSCIPGKDCKPLPVDECEHGELLPHECQCTKYYLCKNGRKALRECQKGWHFDTALLDCTKGSCKEDGDSCRHGAKKEHDCLCEKYYTCSNKEWVVEDCKKGLHFSPTLLKCTDPKNAGCEGTPTPTPTPKPTPGECPDDVPSKWSHECDCRLYYECENKKKKVQACAWGRYFDYFNQVCDVASKVSSKCKNSWDDWV